MVLEGQKMEMRLTYGDIHEMLKLGIKAARDHDESAMGEAAENLVLANDKEWPTLYNEFHEGARNYAHSQGHLNKVMERVGEMADSLMRATGGTSDESFVDRGRRI